MTRPPGGRARPRVATSGERPRQGRAHSGEPGIAGERAWVQGDGRDQRGADRREVPPDPAHRRGQRDVGAEDVRRRFDAARGLDRSHHVLDRVQLAGEVTGEAIGQQTEGLARRPAVVAGNPHPGRRAPGIGPVTDQPTPAARMTGTRGEPCLAPGAARNIGVAGKRALVPQLHRPGRTVAAVASPLLLTVTVDGGPVPSQGAAHITPSDPAIPHRDNPRRTVRGIAELRDCQHHHEVGLRDVDAHEDCGCCQRASTSHGSVLARPRQQGVTPHPTVRAPGRAADDAQAIVRSRDPGHIELSSADGRTAE